MAANPQKKTINLALQGGGAHGAFTWGVLDYILQDERIDIEGISATSAGAMNAAALAYGKSIGGNEKAREVLEAFWHETSKAGALFSPVKRTPWENVAAMNPFMPDWGLENSPAFSFFEGVTSSISPYQFNPMNFNALQTVLEKLLDFDEIHKCDCVKLFIATTDVQNGTSKIFENKDVNIDVLLASAALPSLFHAVEIKGRHYWDGGYMGNPALWPLFYNAKSRDIMLVHVNPIIRDEIPKDAYTIENRLNEITFNSALLKELRSIEFVQKLVREDMLKEQYKDQYKDILLHAIRADEAMSALSIASKFDTDWGFLTHLRDLGAAHAKTWMEANFASINTKGTVDITKDYLNG